MKKILQELIKSGADINAKDKLGWTALIYATIENNRNAAKLLIANNADINAKDSNGNTALMWASHFGHMVIAKLLIDNNADITGERMDMMKLLSILQ